MIGVSDVFTDREMHRVSTDDGRYVDVDGEHLWTVRLSRKRGVFHTYSTEDLYRRQCGAILKTKRGGGVYVKETDSDGKSVRAAMLPAVSPLNQDMSLQRNWVRGCLRPLIETRYVGLSKVVKKKILNKLFVLSCPKRSKKVGA